MQKFVMFVKKIEDKHAKDKKYCKVSNHAYYTSEHRGAEHSIYNLKCT